MVSSIIVAAGSGKRMGTSINKVFLDLDGVPVLYYSIKAFQDHPAVDEIIVVLKEEEIPLFEETFRDHPFSKLRQTVAGGAERMNALKNGWRARSPDSEIVLIHDGARPLVSATLISEAIRFAIEYGAACPAVVPKDTIKVIGEDSLIEAEMPRQSLRAVQTPQEFKTQQFKELITHAMESANFYTDDTSVFFASGAPVYLFPGETKNLKITTAEDLELCRLIRRKTQ